MQVVVRNIPEKLHKEFKLWCVAHDVSIQGELLRLMEKRVGYSPKVRRPKKATLTQPLNN